MRPTLYLIIVKNGVTCQGHAMLRWWCDRKKAIEAFDVDNALSLHGGNHRSGAIEYVAYAVGDNSSDECAQGAIGPRAIGRDRGQVASYQACTTRGR